MTARNIRPVLFAIVAMLVSSCGGGSGSGSGSAETSSADWHLQLASSLNTELSPDGSNVLYPELAMDGQGNAVVLWAQAPDGVSSPRLLMSEFRNGAWINPASRSDYIGPGSSGVNYWPVVMNSQGDALIAWEYGSPSRVLLSERRNGIWTHPATENDSISVGSGYANRPALAMDESGNALVLWSRAEGLFLSEYRNGSWTHPASVSETFNPGGGEVGQYSVAMDDLGNALAAWTQRDSSNDYRLLIGEYRNGAWSKPASVADSISPAGSPVDSSAPKLVMDDQGNALVVWLQQDDDGNRQVFLSEYRGGIWTHPVGLADNISPDGSWVNTFDVATDGLGNALITWYQPTDPNLQADTTKVYRSEYRNNAWVHPVDITDYISASTGKGEFPRVAMSDSGKALHAWLQYDSDALTRHLYVSEYLNGAWSAVRAIPDTYGAHADYRIAMNGQGKYLLAWVRRDSNGTQRFDPSTYQVFATRSE